MDDFLEINSWFDTLFRANEGQRYYTFRAALNLLYQQPRHIIVETGTIRRRDAYWGEGRSTLLFGLFVEKYEGKVITIDISEENMNVCRAVTAGYRNYIQYVVGDSLTVLRTMSDPIDLLYLDSLDCPSDPRADASPAQIQNLCELELAEHLLHDGSVVLLDDNDFENGGKTRLTKQYLKAAGWRLLLNDKQSLWIR